MTIAIMWSSGSAPWKPGRVRDPLDDPHGLHGVRLQGAVPSGTLARQRALCLPDCPAGKAGRLDKAQVFGVPTYRIALL